MRKFGELKSKLLKKLNESYSEKKRDDIKDVLKSIVKNKDFKEMYLFYEDVEGKTLSDIELARQYVNEIAIMIKDKSKKLSDFNRSLEKKLGDVITEVNDVYESLDVLAEEDTLSNIDKKLIAKNKLVNHLRSNKNFIEKTTTIVENENLLNAVLTNNFNILFTESLDKQQKKELLNILSLSNDELINRFTILKEDIESTIGNLITEDTNTDLKDKLTKVLEEASLMDVNKYNYYKLTQLKDGLI